MSNQKELAPIPNLEAEFDQLLENVATVGVILIKEYIKNPKRGHFINWRGEEMVDTRDDPLGYFGQLDSSISDWIEKYFTILTYDEIFEDGIIRRNEHTDFTDKAWELWAKMGNKMGSEPSDGDLVIAWKNDPEWADVPPFTTGYTPEQKQHNAWLQDHPDQLTTYSMYKKYIPKDEVPRLPKRLLRFIEEIKAIRLEEALGIQRSSTLQKPEDYGSYQEGGLAYDIARMVVLERIQRDNNPK